MFKISNICFSALFLSKLTKQINMENTYTSKKIFIVDDDRFFAQLAQKFLNSKGYKQCPAYYSFTDFQNHLHLNPDLIVLDYFFLDEQKNGLDILKMIKMIKPTTKVIMLSSQEFLTVAVKSFKYGVDDYIEKNSTCLKELEMSINNLLNNNINSIAYG
jgi:DNA-binding response OmpR family regulator